MSKQTNIAAQTAVIVAKQGKGIVHAAKAGWYTIVLDSGETIKARARDLTIAGQLKPGYVKAGILTYDPTRYTKHDVRTESGRRAYDVGDKVAKKLRGLAIEDVYATAAEALGVSVKELIAKYGHLNPGQQRMNLGNRMRNAG